MLASRQPLGPDSSFPSLDTGHNHRRPVPAPAAAESPSILEQSFVHLPGVGRRNEATLWAGGLSCWADVAAALDAGATPRDLLRGGAESQLGLFGPEPEADAGSWRAVLEASGRALAACDLTFFTQHLPAAEQWRVLTAGAEALYVDIETTGLSRELHAMTVVGARYRGVTHQWAWPDPLDALADLLAEAPLVVTYNGARFDVPFLRHHVPCMPPPRAHVDLRWVASRSELVGGQKAAEVALGLERDAALRGVDGEAAIALWCRALYGDPSAYETLLAYNRADVVMLERLSGRLCERLAEELASPRRTSRRAGRHTPAGADPDVPPVPLLWGDTEPSTVTAATATTAGEPTTTDASLPAAASPGSPHAVPPRGAPPHAPPPHATVQAAWRARRLTIEALLPAASRRAGRLPVVVGIDLRTKSHNPTGWVRAVGHAVESAILFDDETIFARTIVAAPDLVSIDAPLSLPRGRTTVSDESPCRAVGGIVREAERVLRGRGIHVYPALIRHMQGLTARGIALAARLRAHGIQVIESYPGAAQDVLGIARKGVDVSILAQGLADFGFAVPAGVSHDELDAITCVLVGYCYLADCYEAIGAEDENFMIIPRANAIRWPDVRPRSVASGAAGAVA